MPDRRDRRLLVALALVLVALAFISTRADRSDGGDPRVSTFLATPRGARALFLGLEELDIPVGRRLRDFRKLRPGGGPLAVLAPREAPDPAERDSLAAWVEDGGTLFYVARSAAVTPSAVRLHVLPRDAVLERFGLRLRSLVGTQFDAPDAEGVAALPEPHAWTEGVDSVSGVTRAFDGSSRVLADGAATPLLATREGDVVALVFRHGAGRVVAWSDPGPLTNEALQESGAALLFARAAAAATAEGDSLAFDEYHHGYQADGGPVRGTLRFLADAPAGHAALQLTAAVLGVLLLLGRRFGSPLRRPPRPRRSPLEHVDALGSAYRQAGARDTARRLLVAGLARRLGGVAYGRSRPGAAGRVGRISPAGRSDGPRVARASGTDADEVDLLERLARRLPAGRRHARALLDEWHREEDADLAAMTREIDRLLAEVRQS